MRYTSAGGLDCLVPSVTRGEAVSMEDRQPDGTVTGGFGDDVGPSACADLQSARRCCAEWNRTHAARSPSVASYPSVSCLLI